MVSKGEKPGQVKKFANTTELSQGDSSRLNPLLILRRLAEKVL